MKNPASKQLDLFADIPPAVAGKPKAPRLDEALLQREFANTRQIVRNLTVTGMRPDLTAKEREIVPLLERSARAELKPRIKALLYCREQRGSEGRSPVWQPRAPAGRRVYRSL